MPAPEDEAAPVIIGNQNAGDVKHTLAHLRNGAKNEYAIMIKGCEQDAIDMWCDAKAHGLKHWAKLIMVAPQIPMTREYFLSVVLPLICGIFKVSEKEALAWEHGLDRIADAASPIHFHVALPHFDSSGKVRRTWSNSHLKCERISRELEARLAPLGEKIQLGRHQEYSISEIEKTNPKMADEIKATHPPEAQPANRTPRRPVEQAAQAQGVDLRAIGRTVRAAYDAADDGTQFRELLAVHGLSLVVNRRIADRPAWAIHNENGFLRSVGQCLAGTSLPTIYAKIGEPPHAGPIENDAAGSGHLGIRDAAGDREIPDEAATGHPAPFRMDHQSGSRDQGSVGKVFSRAAMNADAVEADGLRERFLSLAADGLTIARTFLVRIVKRARRFIDEIAPRMVKEPNAFVKGIRDELAVLKATRGAEAALAEFAARTRVYEDHYARQNAEYRRTVVATELASAKRVLDVAARVGALLTERPEVVWMGAPALARLGLVEAGKAAPDARFLVNSGRPPPDEPEGDQGPAWKI